MTKAPFTDLQNAEYAIGMMKVWLNEIQTALIRLQKLEEKPSLEQIKLKRVIREMQEAIDMFSKQLLLCN